MGRVDNTVALITGAARGQGRSHALRLAEEGADLVLTDLCGEIEGLQYELPKMADLEESAKLVRDKGRRAIIVQADVRESKQMDAVVDACRSEYGKLDIFLANAGITSYAAHDGLEDDVWDRVISINLSGVWRSIRPAIPLMKENGKGASIVMTSSAAGVLGMAGLPHYVSAKHGVLGLMRALANELGAFSIRVNAVLPGVVNTPMANNEPTFKLFRPDLEHPTADDADEALRSINLLPVRWVEAQDISNAVLWLASDEARYVTGVGLSVDAGFVVNSSR